MVLLRYIFYKDFDVKLRLSSLLIMRAWVDSATD